MSTIEKYYNERKESNYYKKVVELVNNFNKITSIIDIGGRRSPVLENLNKSIYRCSLDIQPIKEFSKEIHLITANFYTWIPDKKYDIILCLQVLEHLDNPREFAQKLFSVGKIVIISVPYKWPKGFCKYHVQDPVDEKLIKAWVDREPTMSYIISDKNVERIICVYE